MEVTANRFRRLENYHSVDQHEEAIDIRGFKVITNDGTELGKVDTIIADDETDIIRYIEVNTKDHLDSPLNAQNDYRTEEKYKDRFEGGAHYMLIPIGLIDIDKNNFIVNVDGIILENLYTGPRHRKGDDIDSNYEYQVVDKYVQKKDSKFLARFSKFQDTGMHKFDNHFYETDYFRTRRGQRGAPNSPVL